MQLSSHGIQSAGGSLTMTDIQQMDNYLEVQNLAAAIMTTSGVFRVLCAWCAQTALLWVYGSTPKLLLVRLTHRLK